MPRRSDMPAGRSLDASGGRQETWSGTVRRRAGPCVAALALAVLLVPGTARAQDPPGFDVSVNYVYAAQLGFGGYRVGGLDVNVYSLPIEFSLGDVLLDWRLKVALPILYGDYDFAGSLPNADGTDRLRLRAHQKTLSEEPKLKLEIPILEPWTVSLIGAFGIGYAFDLEGNFRYVNDPTQTTRLSEPSFWYYTYQAGVSSLLQKSYDRLTLSLGNAFIYAGTTEFRGDAGVEAYGALETGADARHPLGFRVAGYEPDASLFFIWYYFTPSLEFTRVGKRALQVDNVYEIGVTFGADSATPLALPLLGNPRLGVSYRVGNDLDAVRLNFGFPF